MTEFTNPQLLALSVPFPQRVVKENKSGGGFYVPHHLYTQRLLIHLGGYDFTVSQVIRGHVAEIKALPREEWTDKTSNRRKYGAPALTDAVVGVIARLTVEIDGKTYVIEEAGDCEDPHNWPHDGARMKDAMSDAIKRCCARIGLGTHLYAKTPGDFVLYDALNRRRAGEEGDPEPEDEVPVVGLEPDEKEAGSDAPSDGQPEAPDPGGEPTHDQPPEPGPSEVKLPTGWQDAEDFERAWARMRDTTKSLPDGAASTALTAWVKENAGRKSKLTTSRYAQWEQMLATVDPASGDYVEGSEPF